MDKQVVELDLDALERVKRLEAQERAELVERLAR